MKNILSGVMKIMRRYLFRKIIYLYWFTRIRSFEDTINNLYMLNLDKTKRFTLWYIVSKDIDYAFLKLMICGVAISYQKKKRVGFK